MVNKKLPSLKDITHLRGKRVILRASLNVPIKDGVVASEFRLSRAVQSIEFLKQAGAKVIILGHIGRESEETLAPVADVLQKLVGAKWCPELLGDKAERAVDELKESEVLLLQNLRSDKREKENSDSFARDLAEYGDVYVNDAFSDSHREHASLVAITKFLPSFFGFNFIHEYEELNKAIKPENPSLFLLGGAKFETKLPLVNSYASKYTHVFVGGALANDVFKAQGLEIGKSLVSDVDLKGDALLNRLNVLVPPDVVVDRAGVKTTVDTEAVLAEDVILDAGPKTIEMLSSYIKEAKFILWNGPLGNYERGYNEQTEALAREIVKSNAYSIVGGGDTINSIETLFLQEEFGFLSTAGGAMLVFLEKGTLPAIEAVCRK